MAELIAGILVLAALVAIPLGFVRLWGRYSRAGSGALLLYIIAWFVVTPLMVIWAFFAGFGSDETEEDQ